MPDPISTASVPAPGLVTVPPPVPKAAPVHGRSAYKPPETRVDQCPAHGPYVARLYSSGTVVGATRCPECRKAEDAARKTLLAREQEAARRASIEENLRRASIPPRFRGKGFSGWESSGQDQASALKIVAGYGRNFARVLASGTCLTLCGLPGTGKTHLACALLAETVRQGFTGLYASALSVCRAVKDTYRRDSPRSESQVIDSFVAPDLLVLDEVGVQFGTQTERMILYEIVNGRYERIKPTVSVSNLPLGKLAGFLGGRAMDRLRENGGTTVPFTWASHRR